MKICVIGIIIVVFTLVLSSIALAPGVPLLAFASTVDYNDKPEEQEECEEESDYPSLCSGSNGVSGRPFCDLWDYNVTMRAESYPNATDGCWDRTTDPLAFCEEFDDLTSTYENCRVVPGSEEYIEYLETGGPDESCLFDVYQEKCLPDPVTDKCPEGFGGNEDGYCFPKTFKDGKWDWECPDGYHSTEDDESGQCYPDTEPCYPGHLSNPNSTNCSDEDWICEKFNLTSCLVDGRMIGTFPDESCLPSPDKDKCAAINFECPDGFVTASISNLTITPCLPLSYENAEEATRERRIQDPNRCPPSYNLEDIDEEPEEEYGNVGRCVPN